MTLAQLLTLAEQHRAVHDQSGPAPHPPQQSGPGLLALSRM